MQKSYPKLKNRPKYPKIRYEDETIEEENSPAKENENNNNQDNALVDNNE